MIKLMGPEQKVYPPEPNAILFLGFAHNLLYYNETSRFWTFLPINWLVRVSHRATEASAAQGDGRDGVSGFHDQAQ